MRRLSKLVSVLLVICMAWTPFSAQATMIGTDQVVAVAAGTDNHERVLRFVQRTDVAKQLEAFGISGLTAEERVNVLTPEEIDQLAGNIDSLPAGADTTLSFTATTWLVAAVIAMVIFFVWYRRA